MRVAKFQVLKLIAFALLTMFPSGVMAQEDESKNAPRTGTISGRLVNQNGQPIPHATVFVTTQRSLPQPRTATTDEDGTFQVGELDSQLYFMNAQAPSYINMPREPDSLPTYYRIGDSVTLTMLKGAVMTGTVTSATGEPLVQAWVKAQMIRDASGKPPIGRFPVSRQTDDRGIYRMYGVPPGTYLVSAGGRANFNFLLGAYDNDAPTYSPSSSRDTAAEIVVKPGDEITGVDIRHRGEPGRTISGTVVSPNPAESSSNITLSQTVNGQRQITAFSFQGPPSKGFAFYGVTDGEYDLVAQSNSNAGEFGVSETRHVTLKGADVTGIELVVHALGSIKGKVVLEESSAPECNNKRKPLLTETAVIARRTRDSQEAIVPNFSFGQAILDSTGQFNFRNLAPGHFNLSTRYFAKYWYLRSIKREAAVQNTRPTASDVQSDLAKTGVALKFGEQISGLTITLASGAASIHGVINQGDGGNVPADLYVSLVPAEKESADDVLRFFITPVKADGKFAFGNLPPGKYWTLARVQTENEPRSDDKLRTSDQASLRTQLRRAAEAAKTSLEFNPCQNILDYQLPLKNFSLKN